MYEQDKPLFPLQFGRHGTSSDWCGTTSTPAVKSAPRKEVHIHRKIHVHDLNGSELMLYKGPHGSLGHQHCIRFAGCRCLSIVCQLLRLDDDENYRSRDLGSAQRNQKKKII